ncbi:CreA family protein [Mariluticola halotolerans]|uniref:CreA family protein n=1 Tax=Mariluticola halotolerans TaxID=2909283 RepID=UPI0026E1E3FC|nr:CreA family protein [Mariluticola halotolerans]UJQ93252.1 CreA family protein [Mariluticola halotolerans]
MSKKLARLATALAFATLFAILLGLVPARAEEIGRVGVDWVGNDIVVDAVDDPKVDGVTCHIAYFDRSIIDRLQQGNWFEDPSNSSLDCVQTGPIAIGDIALDKDGEEVFKERRSVILKTLVINRVYDKENDALVYLAHARELNQGSAKMSIAVVPLAGREVDWLNGAPAQRVQPVK